MGHKTFLGSGPRGTREITWTTLGHLHDRRAPRKDGLDLEHISDRRLRKALCKPNGRMCEGCEVACGYGREWLRRKHAVR